MDSKRINRRDFLRFAGVSAFALLGNRLDAFGRSPLPYSLVKSRVNASLTQMDMEPFMPDAEIALTAAEKWVQILPGAQTRVWRSTSSR
jgi:hypothetical protein